MSSDIGWKRPPKGNGVWKKGESGNPAGRPKLTSTQKMVRECAANFAQEAVVRLAAIMRGSRDEAEVRLACIALLNRAVGLPALSTDLDDEESQTINITVGASTVPREIREEHLRHQDPALEHHLCNECLGRPALAPSGGN